MGLPSTSAVFLIANFGKSYPRFTKSVSEEYLRYLCYPFGHKAWVVCTVNSTSEYTPWTSYRSYFRSFSDNIELQVYSVTCCWPHVCMTNLPRLLMDCTTLVLLTDNTPWFLVTIRPQHLIGDANIFLGYSQDFHTEFLIFYQFQFWLTLFRRLSDLYFILKQWNRLTVIGI
jgi:hypothetical protein